jgi:hypothetical protein
MQIFPSSREKDVEKKDEEDGEEEDLLVDEETLYKDYGGLAWQLLLMK